MQVGAGRPSSMSALLGPGGSTPERVLVVRALAGLGDLLCAVPAWRALRRALPQATIALLGLPPAKAVLARTGYVDDLVPFRGYPGIVESPTTDPAQVVAALSDIQARRFDLAIQMHGSGLVSNALTALLGARATAGFFLPGQYCPDPQRFLPYPTDEPEVRRHLRLMGFLGAQPCGEEMEFRLLPDDEEEWARLRQRAGLGDAAYACIHPGASIAPRRWGPAGFARVGDELADRGLRVVLTGTDQERGVTATVAGAMRAPAVDAAGATSVGGLGALMRGSRIVVTNDTGTSHLAAALNVPSVVIFTTSDRRRWAPLNAERHVPVAAAGTSNASLTPSAPAVVQAVDKVLSSTSPEFDLAGG